MIDKPQELERQMIGCIMISISETSKRNKWKKNIQTEHHTEETEEDREAQQYKEEQKQIKKEKEEAEAW